MDRYEYNVKSDKIKKLYLKKDYSTIAEIADTIDWTRVKSNSMLTMVADAYEGSRQFDKARDVLEIAYDRAPLGRQLAYRLTILSIRMKDFVAADEYYQDFVEIAPRDVAQYILKYRIARAKGEDIGSLISILEAYVDVEMDERWQYELAKLYHESGRKDECIAMCDKIILWFAEGKYVTKAMELKMKYEPLTEEQQAKYDGKWDYYNERIKAEVAADKEAYGIKDEEEASDDNETSDDGADAGESEDSDLQDNVSEGDISDSDSDDSDSVENTENTDNNGSSVKESDNDTVKDNTADGEIQEHKEEKPWDNMEDIINDTTALDYLTDYTEEEKLNIEEEPEDNSDEAAAAVEEQLAKMVDESMEEARNAFGSGENETEDIDENKSDKDNSDEDNSDSEEQEYTDMKDDTDELAEEAENEESEEDSDDEFEDESEAEMTEDEDDEYEDESEAGMTEDSDDEFEDGSETESEDIYETPENAYIKPLLGDDDEDVDDMDDKELMAKSVSDEDFVDGTSDDFYEDDSYLEDEDYEDEDTAEEEISEETDSISEEGDDAVENDSMSGNGSKSSNDKIEIFEFNENSDSRASKIGEELTKTAEIDIDEVNFRVKQYDENMYNTANIQAALAQSMKLIMRAESEKTTRNAFAQSESLDEPTKRIDLPDRNEETQPEEIHKGPLYETVPLQPIYNKAEDGQIYLLQPEEDQQIEGQMDFDDVLRELENRKKEALEEATRKEQMAIEAARKAAEEAVAAKEAVAKAIAEEAAARETLEKAAQAGAEVMAQIPVEDTSDIPANATILEIDSSAVYGSSDIPSEQTENQEDKDTENISAAYDNNKVEDIYNTQAEYTDDAAAFEGNDTDMTVSDDDKEIYPDTDMSENADEDSDTDEAVNAADETAATDGESDEASEEEGKKLSDENRKVFADFLETKGMENDIATVLENLIDGFVKDGTSRTNNLIVMGDAKTGKTSLALGIIKIANKGRGRNGRRVAKVKATVLNKKGITAAMSQIMGTDLIIEQAGNLMPGTVVDMVAAMKLYTDEMIIVLEDDRAAVDRLIETNPIINEMFNNKLCIREFSIDDYVKVAKQYAQEQNYVIDEMGTLALFAKIDDISGKNQGITREEIEEIIDDAIVHAERFKFSKLIGKIKRTRYEMGVLKEEDFQ